jgi:hypothetical protein
MFYCSALCSYVWFPCAIASMLLVKRDLFANKSKVVVEQLRTLNAIFMQIMTFECARAKIENQLIGSR